MAYGICFIVLAGLLYSLSIWSEHFTGRLKKWMLIAFTAALLCDFSGTSIMGWQHRGVVISFHSIAGFSALIIMAIHFWLAINAFRQQNSNFHRWSPKAWLLWMIAFISGTPLPKMIWTVIH